MDIKIRIAKKEDAAALLNIYSYYVENTAITFEYKELTNLLKEINAFELDGYHVEERMTGGRSYRIYMEFSGGEKLNATWFTHSPRALAEEAYSIILRKLKAVTERPRP